MRICLFLPRSFPMFPFMSCNNLGWALSCVQVMPVPTGHGYVFAVEAKHCRGVRGARVVSAIHSDTISWWFTSSNME